MEFFLKLSLRNIWPVNFSYWRHLGLCRGKITFYPRVFVKTNKERRETNSLCNVEIIWSVASTYPKPSFSFINNSGMGLCPSFIAIFSSARFSHGGKKHEQKAWEDAQRGFIPEENITFWPYLSSSYKMKHKWGYSICQQQMSCKYDEGLMPRGRDQGSSAHLLLIPRETKWIVMLNYIDVFRQLMLVSRFFF